MLFLLHHHLSYNEIIKDANAAMTPLEKCFVQTHNLCVTVAMRYQLNYQSHMRVVVSGFGPLCSVESDVILT